MLSAGPFEIPILLHRQKQVDLQRLRVGFPNAGIVFPAYEFSSYRGPVCQHWAKPGLQTSFPTVEGAMETARRGAGQALAVPDNRGARRRGPLSPAPRRRAPPLRADLARPRRAKSHSGSQIRSRVKETSESELLQTDRPTSSMSKGPFVPAERKEGGRIGPRCPRRRVKRAEAVPDPSVASRLDPTHTPTWQSPVSPLGCRPLAR